jgi:hypothetical protein
MRKGLAYLDVAERCRKMASQVTEPRVKKKLESLGSIMRNARCTASKTACQTSKGTARVIAFDLARWRAASKEKPRFGRGLDTKGSKLTGSLVPAWCGYSMAVAKRAPPLSGRGRGLGSPHHGVGDALEDSMQRTFGPRQRFL